MFAGFFRAAPYLLGVPDLDFHQVHIGVRPTRAAVRIGSYDGWHHAALRVLETLSVTWGGAGDVIVTTDDSGASPDAVWAAIELFDPDVWATHVATYRGYQLRDPEGYEAFLDQQVAQLEGGPAETSTERRSQVHELLTREPLSGWEPPESFWARARERLAPSWDVNYGHAEVVNDDELPSGLLVDVTQLSPLPDAVVVADTAALPAPVRLLAASRWGTLSPAGQKALEARGVEVREVHLADSDTSRVVTACWGGSTWPSEELRRALAMALGEDPEDDELRPDLGVLDTNGPFAISMMGLGWFSRPVPVHRDWPLALVLGDAASDFSLAMILDRLMGPALWVPPGVLGDQTARAVANVLTAPRRRYDRDRTVHVTSTSLTPDALADFVKSMEGMTFGDPERIIPSPRVPLPEDRPLTVADVQLSSSVEDELFIGDSTGRGLRARLPSSVQADGPFNLSWWNDVVRFDHRLPPRWPLNEQLVARSGSWRSRARVTREGLAFHSHPLGFISGGQRLDQIVDNPRLRFLDAATVFKILAEAAGVGMVESPAGKYTARTIELWGGLPRLIEDLQDRHVRGVLDAFQSTASSGQAPGNYLGDRRYLTLSDLGTAAGDNDVAPLLDRLLVTGVLRRGLSLRCVPCNHFGFYDADDVGQRFRCYRCRTETTIESQAVRGGSTEPAWYYALAEVVYQACRANFNVPVLALHAASHQAKSVLAITDHEFRLGQGDTVEIDVCAVIDGKIVLGEAKSSTSLGSTAAERKKKARRLRRAADLLTADKVLLASAASAWESSSLSAIEGAFKGSRCAIEVLSSVDPILSAPSP